MAKLCLTLHHVGRVVVHGDRRLLVDVLTEKDALVVCDLMKTDLTLHDQGWDVLDIAEGDRYRCLYSSPVDSGSSAVAGTVSCRTSLTVVTETLSL